MSKLIRKVELDYKEVIRALSEHVMNKPGIVEVVTKQIDKVRVETKIYAPFMPDVKLEDIGVIVEVFVDE